MRKWLLWLTLVSTLLAIISSMLSIVLSLNDLGPRIARVRTAFRNWIARVRTALRDWIILQRGRIGGFLSNIVALARGRLFGTSRFLAWVGVGALVVGLIVGVVVAARPRTTPKRATPIARPQTTDRPPPLDSQLISQGNAVDYCGYDALAAFADTAPADVAQAMFETWSSVGPVEIGCPDWGVERKKGMFVAELARGESAALLTSDARGRAAVVFESLAPEVRHLWKEGGLAYVAPRTSSGLGDHQLFYTNDGSCVLGTRPSYSDRYFLLAPAATALLLDESVRRDAYPVVVEAHHRRGRTIYDVVFDADAPQEQRVSRLVVDRESGAAWIKGRAGRRVSPRDAPCSSGQHLSRLAESRAKRVRPVVG